jgi:3-oxoacyl-[acyl-carrier protein] reductase
MTEHAATDSVSERPMLAPELIEQFSLRGRIAVITGAAGGIGRQAAITFAQAGADVVIADVGVEGLEGTAALVAEVGGTALVVPTDVSDRDAVEALAAAALDAHGRIDVWANVAGIIRYAPITEVTPDDLAAIVGVNQFGTYWGVAAAARIMAANSVAEGSGKRGGSIINITSAGGDMPAPTLSVYAMTKAAVAHLTRCAAVEFGPSGIRVNAVAPGFTDTPMVQGNWTRPDGSVDEEARSYMMGVRAAQSPLGTTASPEDQTLAMLYLASDASKFVTGQILRPNGGVYMA